MPKGVQSAEENETINLLRLVLLSSHGQQVVLEKIYTDEASFDEARADLSGRARAAPLKAGSHWAATSSSRARRANPPPRNNGPGSARPHSRRALRPWRSRRRRLLW